MPRKAVRGVMWIAVNILLQFLHDGNEIIYFHGCAEIANEKNLLYPVPLTTVRGTH